MVGGQVDRGQRDRQAGWRPGGRMDGWTNGWMGGWTNGRMGRWLDGRMGGWTDERMEGRRANRYVRRLIGR